MKPLLLILLLTSSLCAMSAKPKVYQDYHILGLDTNKRALTAKDIEKAMIKGGLTVIENNDMTALVNQEATKVSYDSYHTISYFHKDISSKLVEKIGHMGMFYPASLSVYKKKSDPYLWVSFLSARTYGKILKLREKEMLLAKLDTTILSSMLTLSKMPRFFRVGSSQQRERKTISLQSIKVPKNVDVQKLQKSIFSQLQMGLKKQDIKIKSQTDIKKELTGYDFYQTFSLSRDKVVQTLSQSYPETGAYTPFTLIVYKRKNTPHVIFAHPDVANIIDSSNIVEEKSLRLLNAFEADLESFLKTIKQ